MGVSGHWLGFHFIRYFDLNLTLLAFLPLGLGLIFTSLMYWDFLKDSNLLNALYAY
jgi:hypothetical protein